MPEIAEVYRAAMTLRRAALHKTIRSVNTIEDDLVFVGGATNFKDTLQGQRVTAVERYGKHFYMTMANEKSILFHLGMSGYVHIRGEAPLAYRRKPKDPDAWPPKYFRFAMTLDDETEFAFMDSRRFGRIKVLNTVDPFSVPPMNKLGFDAISRMATLEQFEAIARKRKCPIKALLLNQQFLAGVGNWVADEILYQSKVHPAQICKTLSSEQIARLWKNTIDVCETAVKLNADHNLFPAHWLFKYRWGKSHASRKKKQAKLEDDENSILSSEDEKEGKMEANLGKVMKTKDGRTLRIEWITCGGRTSAFVVDEQILPPDGADNVQETVKTEDVADMKVEEEVSLDTMSPQATQLEKPKSKKRKIKAHPEKVESRTTRRRSARLSETA